MIYSHIYINLNQTFIGAGWLLNNNKTFIYGVIWTITLIYLYDYRVNNKSYSDSVISVSYYPNMFVSTFPHYSQ